MLCEENNYLQSTSCSPSYILVTPQKQIAFLKTKTQESFAKLLQLIQTCYRSVRVISARTSVTLTSIVFFVPFSYGDKVPRSVGGRLFGVVWINVGLVILAIYMGIVTSSLSSNSLEQRNNIDGMPVSIHLELGKPF